MQVRRLPKAAHKNVSIAAVAEFDHEKTNLILTGAYQPYTVFCSDEFLKNILTECEPGSLCGSFVTGDKTLLKPNTAVTLRMYIPTLMPAMFQRTVCLLK